MSLIITDSPDITLLDSRLIADLCAGKFYVDLSPSVWIGGQDAYTGGASVKIVNPLGVTIHDYTTSGYDIEPPMTDVFEYPIPLVAGNYLYGTYVISVRLTDSDGNEYVVTKNVNICVPDSKNPTKKVGCLNAKMEGNCTTGVFLVILNTPPNYKGKTVESQVTSLTLKYPTESGLDPLTTTNPVFSVQVYEGEYKLSGYVCATYNYGDNVYFKVKYEVRCSKWMKCLLDECCIQAQLFELNNRLKTDCTAKEKEATTEIIFDALRLLKSIEVAAKCGADPSEYISELEELLGCICTCNCNLGMPIINTALLVPNTTILKGIITPTDGIAPTLTILQNTTGATWTTSYNGSVGEYVLTVDGILLDELKTHILNGVTSTLIQMVYNTETEIFIKVDPATDFANPEVISFSIELFP